MGVRAMRLRLFLRTVLTSRSCLKGATLLTGTITAKKTFSSFRQRVTRSCRLGRYEEAAAHGAGDLQIAISKDWTTTDSGPASTPQVDRGDDGNAVGWVSQPWAPAIYTVYLTRP